MNTFKRIYCRVFQQAFHIAIPFLPYREPKIIDSLSGLPEVLAAKGKCNPLIITDRGLHRLGLAKGLMETLDKAGVTYSYYAGVDANPTTAMAREAYGLYQTAGCDSIIAIGGGSAMDTAKAVGVLSVKKNKDLYRYKGILRVMRRIPLLIAIPTTAGTGSETTLACVLVDSRTRHKFCINDFPLIPRYAVLDESLTVSLPPRITAETGLDALTHAVEAYIGNSTTRRTRQDSIKAITLISENLLRAYRNGGDLEARKNMLVASFHAGCAFTKSYVGYVHAIAHSLGGRYNTPHGRANAVLLPVLLRGYGEAIYGKLAKLSDAIGLSQKGMYQKEKAELFLTFVENLERKMNIPTSFPELKAEDIPEMARIAEKEANPLYPVPVLWDAEDLEMFYHMVEVKHEEGRDRKSC